MSHSRQDAGIDVQIAEKPCSWMMRRGGCAPCSPVLPAAELSTHSPANCCQLFHLFLRGSGRDAPQRLQAECRPHLTACHCRCRKQWTAQLWWYTKDNAIARFVPALEERCLPRTPDLPAPSLPAHIITLHTLLLLAQLLPFRLLLLSLPTLLAPPDRRLLHPTAHQTLEVSLSHYSRCHLRAPLLPPPQHVPPSVRGRRRWRCH